MANASWSATKYITLATLLVACVYAFVLSTNGQDRYLSVAAWTAVPIVCVYPLATHLEVLFRTRDDFARFARIQLLGYVTSIISLAFVYAFSFVGQCIRLVLNAGVNLLFRWAWRPLRTTRAGNWRDARSLSVIGLPFLVVTYLYGVFGVADRSVIALRLGTEAVGYYSLVGVVLASMSAFPMAITQVLLPRASNLYGATGNASDLRRYLWLSSALTLGVLLPIAAVGWWVLPSLVALVLPEYTSGVYAAQIALFAGAIGLPGLTIVFTVLRRNRVYIFALAFCTGLIWLLSWFALGRGGDLVAVAAVRLIATIVLSVSAFVYALYLTR